MKWTEEQTIKFISEYVKHECLYNVNCSNYGVRYWRNAALLKISERMGIKNFGPKDAHQKLRSLKSTYSQELKKIKDSAKSSLVYTPNIKWFKILHNAMTANGTEECRENNHVETEHLIKVHEIDQNVNYENDTRLNEVSSPNSDSQIKEDNTDVFRVVPIKINRRKRKLSDYDNCIEGKNVAHNDNYLGQSENEFDIFGSSIAAQLKNMPLDRAIEAQMFIQNYLSDMRLRALQRITYNRLKSKSQFNDEIV